MRAAVAGRLGLVFQLQTAHVCLIWLRKLPAGTEYEVLSTECAAGTTRDFVLRGAWFPVSECHGGHSLQVNTRSLPNAHCFSGQKPGDKNGRFSKQSRKFLQDGAGDLRPTAFRARHVEPRIARIYADRRDAFKSAAFAESAEREGLRERLRVGRRVRAGAGLRAGLEGCAPFSILRPVTLVGVCYAISARAPFWGGSCGCL